MSVARRASAGALGIVKARIVRIAGRMAERLLSLYCKDPRLGQPSAHESPVPNGRIVLLRRRKEFAAFMLENQAGEPERMDFSWYYRSDGKGTFAAGDPAVSSGHVLNASQVAFATFTVRWSVHTDGLGWVYFSLGPTEFGKAADYLMCVTTETNLALIDATHYCWKYRARQRADVRALIHARSEERRQSIVGRACKLKQ